MPTRICTLWSATPTFPYPRLLANCIYFISLCYKTSNVADNVVVANNTLIFFHKDKNIY